jgi:glutathione S-transferase
MNLVFAAAPWQEQVMRTLYHYRYSPFSRRVRLALAHKGLDATLYDGREDPARVDEARRLVPLRTLPVYVDGGRAMGDSNAITRWLDLAYPQAPPIWPDGSDAVDVLHAAVLVDAVLNHVIDLATRYYVLGEHPAWNEVKREMLGRAEVAANGLRDLVQSRTRKPLSSTGWSAGDIWLLTMVLWFEGLPARAAGNANVTRLVALGFTLPPSLTRWADAHRERPDVRALG